MTPGATDRVREINSEERIDLDEGNKISPISKEPSSIDGLTRCDVLNLRNLFEVLIKDVYVIACLGSSPPIVSRRSCDSEESFVLIHRELVQDMTWDLPLCDVGDRTSINGNFMKDCGFLGIC